MVQYNLPHFNASFAALADATAKLQSALTPEQAKTLAELTRHPMGQHRGGARGEQGPRGPMGGMGGMR